MAEIHISSLVIQHTPERTAALKDAVTALPGLDWHAAENGKAIVTVVTATEGEVLNRIDAINAMAGVHTTTLVYHHYEDAEACAEPLPGESLPGESMPGMAHPVAPAPSIQ